MDWKEITVGQILVWSSGVGIGAGIKFLLKMISVKKAFPTGQQHENMMQNTGYLSLPAHSEMCNRNLQPIREVQTTLLNDINWIKNILQGIQNRMDLLMKD